MTTYYIDQATASLAGSSSEAPEAVESANPISTRNLLIVKKFSKGKFPIYKTQSQLNKQYYVMKVFDGAVKDSYECYKNELRFTSLNHPNVVNIVSHGRDRIINQKGLSMNVTYVLSEYASRGDFLDLIVNHRNDFDDKLVRTYFRQLIEGIEYLHAKSIAHLDIKPENLLIAEDYSLKITDFDLSYFSGDRKIISRGTKFYRAPEFYNSHTMSVQLENPYAADIYSAAIILFILMSGGVYPHLEHQEIRSIDFTKLMERESSRFWSKHIAMQGKSKDFFYSDFRSLFEKMVKTNPRKRISIKKIKESKWYNGSVYTPQELQEKMGSMLEC